MDATTHRYTLIGTNNKKPKDDLGSNIDHSLYRSMIGSLLYLITSRPDICYSLGVCARYQASPIKSFTGS